MFDLFGDVSGVRSPAPKCQCGSLIRRAVKVPHGSCGAESFKLSNLVAAPTAVLRKNHWKGWERARCRILPNARRMPWSSASGRGGQPAM